ncbi:MAG: glycosyltransferase family 4 protein [Ignavibacteria bacterium]|nr:glycosyltransferase family 4 protein [Ignavibacteria bacterium]
MKKKIAYLCLSKSLGGLEYHSVNLVKWLNAREWDITLIISVESSVKLKIVEYSLPYVEIENPKKYYDIFKAKKIANFILKNNIGILICGDNNDLNFASLVRMFCGNKIKLIYLQQMQIGIKKKDLFHNITHSKVDEWVTPLEYLKKQALERTNVKSEKIHIIRYGIEFEKFLDMKDKTEARKIMKLPEKSFIIGMLGRIDRLKGQGFLIEYMNNKGRKTGDGLYLVISGEPTKNEPETYFNELKEKVSKYNLTDSIIFTGNLDNVTDFFSAIDLFVMASESETYGLVTIEAMMSGTPVIGTNAGGTPELLKFGEYGILYEPGNMEDFSVKILNILNDYNFYLDRAGEVREKVLAEYSYHPECEKLEKLF